MPLIVNMFTMSISSSTVAALPPSGRERRSCRLLTAADL
jgi:hypothetical protein